MFLFGLVLFIESDGDVFLGGSDGTRQTVGVWCFHLFVILFLKGE